MLLINLQTILYNLQNLRAYVLKNKTTKSNVTLLANNSIVFSLTKNEIINIKKFQPVTGYSKLLFTYNKINYLDDQYQHLSRHYPVLKTITTNETKFLNQFWKIIQQTNKITQLSSVILSRTKTHFRIRLLGLLGQTSLHASLILFAQLWNKNQIINYKNFVKLMLNWLHKNLTLTVNAVFLKFLLQQKNLKITTKTNKKFLKKQSKHKTLILVSSDQIILN